MKENKLVEIGKGPPLPIRPLPNPPKVSHLFGPGIILTAIGVGLGEAFMWPRMVVLWGSGVLWLFLLGVTVQLFVMIEMARWEMATGESIFFGIARIWRPFTWLFWSIAMITYIWPGHVSLGAHAISFATGIDWTILAMVGMALIAFVLSVSPIVYSVVEKFCTYFIAFMVIIAGIITFMVATPAELAKVLTGLFSFGYWHPEMSLAAFLPFVLGSIAFAGPSGMQQMWYTLWLRDYGAGMGKYVGRITSWLTGKEESIPERGYTWDIKNPEEWKKWKGWRRWNLFDSVVLFWGLTILCTIIFSTMALSVVRLDPSIIEIEKGGKTALMLKAFANVFAKVGGTIAHYLYFLLIGIVGWKMSFGIFDAFSRGQADMTWYFALGARKWHMRKWYYAFLYFVTVVGVAMIYLGSPKGPVWLLTVLAAISAPIMGIYCVFLLYINNRLLPKEIRPHLINNLLLAIGAGLYLISSMYCLLVLGAPLE